MAKARSMSSGPGVYIIYCHENEKAYIGSSNRVNARLAHHRCDLRASRHGNQHLQNAWNLYGEDSFSMGMIHACDLDQQVSLEQFYIDIWMESEMVFNRHPKADSPIGVKWTNEEKLAASKRVKANPPFKGRQHSESSRALLSAHAKSRLAVPENNPFFGKTHSEDTKEKISVANTGNKYCLGRAASEKCKMAVSESNRRRIGEKRIKVK